MDIVKQIIAGWFVHRDAIDTVDSPSTGGNTRDAPDDVTERLVAYMVDTDEAAITPINVDKRNYTVLELRAHFNDNAGTATTPIFAARKGDKSVKMIAEVAWTAGTQVNENGRYFAKTASITQYWPKTIAHNGADESGTGIDTVEFDTRGYERFWVFVDALSASDTVTIEASGYA